MMSKHQKEEHAAYAKITPEWKNKRKGSANRGQRKPNTNQIGRIKQSRYVGVCPLSNRRLKTGRSPKVRCISKREN